MKVYILSEYDHDGEGVLSIHRTLAGAQLKIPVGEWEDNGFGRWRNKTMFAYAYHRIDERELED